jgi:hypothetical protein
MVAVDLGDTICQPTLHTKKLQRRILQAPLLTEVAAIAVVGAEVLIETIGVLVPE